MVLLSLLSVPPLLLFYLTWVVFSLLRPLLVVLACCVLWNLPTTVAKLRLGAQGVAYMLLCKDKKYKVEDVEKWTEGFKAQRLALALAMPCALPARLALGSSLHGNCMAA